MKKIQDVQNCFSENICEETWHRSSDIGSFSTLFWEDFKPEECVYNTLLELLIIKKQRDIEYDSDDELEVEIPQA